MRLFFGLDLPRPLKQSIADWRDRSAVAEGRPVPVKNFHITLAFLGEVKPLDLDGLVQSVDELLSDRAFQRFNFTLDTVGYWPSPRIYWLGCSHVPEGLVNLARQLGKIGSRHGQRRDRRKYTPHVTLYRSCQSPPIQPINQQEFKIECDSFVLFESSRGRKGVSYHPVAEWPLR